MDIYLPAGRTKNTRLIVMIHGGGWQAGDKNEFNYYKNLIRQKWPEAAIANVNYRLASNVNNIHHNQIMSDISAAVQFLISNKISFAVSDTLAMVGESAGAHLSMLYTYAYNTNNYVKCVGSLYGPTQIADWDWYNSFNLFFGRPVSEILSTYVGSTWNADLYKSISPYERVNASNAKPTIIFHGTVDVVVPIYQSQWLNGKLGNLGAVHQYHEYFLDGHGFNSTNAADCATKLVAFFKQNAK